MMRLRLHTLAAPIHTLGPYSRFGIWVQGCRRACPGCITPEAQAMDGGYEMSFMDVVNHIESNYRVYKDKKHRAIAGLSMGGYHSLHISKYYPDMFDYVGLFSAAAWLRDHEGVAVYQNQKDQLIAQFSKKPALYWIAIGDDDYLYKSNVKFRETLDEIGAEYEYHESKEGHIWRNWRVYLTMFTQRLFK